jgi:hypothetical protein
MGEINSMHLVTMCKECGEGYLVVAPSHTMKCELCGTKSEVVVYDVDRSEDMSGSDKVDEKGGKGEENKSAEIQGDGNPIRISGPKTGEDKPKETKKAKP